MTKEGMNIPGGSANIISGAFYPDRGTLEVWVNAPHQGVYVISYLGKIFDFTVTRPGQWEFHQAKLRIPIKKVK